MPAKVIIAEDSSLVLMGLEMLLEQNGIEVLGSAVTFAEAMTLAETTSPDVAILDVNLQDEMSWPVADVLAARGVPVVFATGYAPEEMLPPPFRLGFRLSRSPIRVTSSWI